MFIKTYLCTVCFIMHMDVDTFVHLILTADKPHIATGGFSAVCFWFTLLCTYLCIAMICNEIWSTCHSVNFVLHVATYFVQLT